MARNDFIKRLNEVIAKMSDIIEEHGNSRDQILVKFWYEHHHHHHQWQQLLLKNSIHSVFSSIPMVFLSLYRVDVGFHHPVMFCEPTQRY